MDKVRNYEKQTPNINTTTVLRAIAVVDGTANSDVATATYFSVTVEGTSSVTKQIREIRGGLPPFAAIITNPAFIPFVIFVDKNQTRVKRLFLLYRLL